MTYFAIKNWHTFITSFFVYYSFDNLGNGAHNVNVLGHIFCFPKSSYLFNVWLSIKF